MTTTTINYGSKTAYTTSGVASLASSATAGYETNEIDNTTTKYDDFLIDGFITVGTTPTINTNIFIYALASLVSQATDPKDVFDGTASAETLTTAGVGRGFLKLIAVLDIDATTSNVKYNFGPVSLASFYGGVCPPFHELFINHNTVAALNATAGNHAISYMGIKYDNA